MHIFLDGYIAPSTLTLISEINNKIKFVKFCFFYLIHIRITTSHRLYDFMFYDFIKSFDLIP